MTIEKLAELKVECLRLAINMKPNPHALATGSPLAPAFDVEATARRLFDWLLEAPKSNK